MKKKLLHQGKQSIAATMRRSLKSLGSIPAYLDWYWQKHQHESIYFYTFHKCASTLFSNYLLKQIRGLRHIDYANQIYLGKQKQAQDFIFAKTGYIYGPIRLSADPRDDVYRFLVAPTSQVGFIADKRAIFFIRDPRDILVSSYYSVAYTHGYSPVAEIQDRQAKIRTQVQQMTLDEYALREVVTVKQHFLTLWELSQVCQRGVVLKYEDMIENFNWFAAQLTKYVAVEDKVLREIFARSRPKLSEDTTSHRRSGLPGGFRQKLQPATIQAVNQQLAEILTKFTYLN